MVLELGSYVIQQTIITPCMLLAAQQLLSHIGKPDQPTILQGQLDTLRTLAITGASGIITTPAPVSTYLGCHSSDRCAFEFN